MSAKITFFYKKTRRNILTFNSQVIGGEREFCGNDVSKLVVSCYPRHFRTKKKLFQTSFVWNDDVVYSNSSFKRYLLGDK